MSKKPFISMASMNPTAMTNFNRMTYLMSISEITPQLFISGQMAATADQIQKLGITYIVNVAVESSLIVYPKSVKIEKFDITDFPTAPISNYFNALTEKIHAHITVNKQNKVLVHCMAGVSRSTTIVCAYLVRFMNMSLRDAYLLCRRHRPICFPNLGFWNQLIAFEYQIRKENSVKMVPTQYGHIPDVAFEDIKQIRNQPVPVQQQPVSLPFFAPTFVSTTSSPSITSPTTNDSLFLTSNQTRPAARDPSFNNSPGTIRSRSLANRPSVPVPAFAPVPQPSITNINNPTYQNPLIVTNRQAFSTPTRYSITRLNLPAPTSNNITPVSTTISPVSNYINNRNLPISTSPNIRSRTNPHLQQSSVAASLSNPASSGQQRSNYETTYRSSFIKPLIP